jgi:mannosyl-oligosaccharide alpha-1,3-glucosidase
LAISVAGISFCGADIGGFFGDPEEELYARWTQAASYQPFFRNHAANSSAHREPYLDRYSNETRKITKDAIVNRYKFLPLWYTLFYEHEITGIPVMRPMLSQYPLDKNGYKLDNQYMLGNVLLVHPVVQKGVRSVNVYFPSTDGAQNGEIWYDVIDYSTIEHVGFKEIPVTMDHIPVYQRGGTILAKKLTPRKSSAHMKDDPVSIFVTMDKSNHAVGKLYSDDGETYAYRKTGHYQYLDLHFHDKVLSSKDKNDKKFNNLWVDKVFFAGVKTTIKSATFTCNKNNHTHTFGITKYNDNVFYVDVAEDGADCDMDWSLELNGSVKNIINGSLLLIITLFNLIKYYF